MDTYTTTDMSNNAHAINPEAEQSMYSMPTTELSNGNMETTTTPLGPVGIKRVYDEAFVTPTQEDNDQRGHPIKRCRPASAEPTSTEMVYASASNTITPRQKYPYTPPTITTTPTTTAIDFSGYDFDFPDYDFNAGDHDETFVYNSDPLDPEDLRDIIDNNFVKVIAEIYPDESYTGFGGMINIGLENLARVFAPEMVGDGEDSDSKEECQGYQVNGVAEEVKETEEVQEEKVYTEDEESSEDDSGYDSGYDSEEESEKEMEEESEEESEEELEEEPEEEEYEEEESEVSEEE
ncbi:hypothetical protein F4813DRAFT_398772 [Daldinia decipiens]|uniref:uncharacterized protein n=1 Tax=Daldinia decipiens TaxID=326647 RepID=UPI0020C44CA1|nr:uncharacterized protein F4813DRAFT_398772 [Daldinia decipiens]KAI1654839.1 hypothetical protein F4813DRAFT_398772 [Daldinia decipiens]